MDRRPKQNHPGQKSRVPNVGINPVAPDHDAWMKAEIENTLAKKQAGKMSYHSLEEAMQRFGFDAR